MESSEMASSEMDQSTSDFETKEIANFRNFRFVRILDTDTGKKCINLLGTIDGQHAIIVAEKTAFTTSPDLLSRVHEETFLGDIHVLGQNDIYHWYLASHAEPDNELRPEVKFTLIYPCTETHIRKYSKQNLRMVVETPEIYRKFVKPFVDNKREDGRLNWVYNILAHEKERDRIVYEDKDEVDGWVLLPDLKWDQKTMSALYLMALVRRRDITSMRDLKKKHVPWLRKLEREIKAAICQHYGRIEEDEIKTYIHYQPSYYHFHIHAVMVSHDGGQGQTAGKAFLLGNVISQLEGMRDEESGFEDIELTYVLGEASELWQNVFAGLKEKMKEKQTG